jgi:hypothetical protein
MECFKCYSPERICYEYALCELEEAKKKVEDRKKKLSEEELKEITKFEEKGSLNKEKEKIKIKYEVNFKHSPNEWKLLEILSSYPDGSQNIYKKSFSDETATEFRNFLNSEHDILKNISLFAMNIEEKESIHFLSIGYSYLIPLQVIKPLFLEAIDKAVKDGSLKE